MENKNLKVAVYLLTGMVGFGLGLIAVSLFMSFLDINVNPLFSGFVGASTASLELFDEDWSMLGVSPAFVIISYVVLIVGLIIVAVDASIKQKLKRKIKGLNFGGLAVTVIGFALLLVSVIVTRGQVEDSMDQIMIAAFRLSGEGADMSNEEILFALRSVMSYGLGIGTIMAIIGGVIALIGSILLVIPALDPIKLAEQPEATPAAAAAATATTTTEAPAEPVAPTTEANDNNNNDTIA